MFKPSALPVLLLAYAAASLLHFVHNAEFLDEYPNKPAGLSRGMIYAAWRRGLTLAGLGVLGLEVATAGLLLILLAGELRRTGKQFVSHK